MKPGIFLTRCRNSPLPPITNVCASAWSRTPTKEISLSRRDGGPTWNVQRGIHGDPCLPGPSSAAGATGLRLAGNFRGRRAGTETLDRGQKRPQRSTADMPPVTWLLHRSSVCCDPSAPSTSYLRVQLVCQRSGQGAARSEWPFPFTRAGTPPWMLTGQPFGRACGAALRRSRACQGGWPLPAHGALQRNATGTLNPQIGC